MRFEINGLVLRENAVGENDAYLDLLTAENGRMSVYARGVRSYKSRNREATLPITYSTFTLDRQRDDFTVVTEAQQLRSFGASHELERNALSMYVIELLREFSLADTPQPELLRLALNTLHAASDGLYPLRHIKAAFEIRLMADEGYAPDLSGCGRCGRLDTDDMYVDIMNGALICGACLEKRGEQSDEGGVPDDGTATVLAPVSRAAVEAMDYAIRAPLNRLFAFKLEPAAAAELNPACEKYLLNHLERSFPTLDFFKQTEEMTRDLNKLKENSTTNEDKE